MIRWLRKLRARPRLRREALDVARRVLADVISGQGKCPKWKAKHARKLLWEAWHT